MYSKGFLTQSPEPVTDGLALQDSFDAFASAISEAGSFVEGHQWYGSPEEQAEAYRHILRTLVRSIETNALGEPDFPFFVESTPFNTSGMDNADQRYLITMLSGGGTYRIWGERGSSRRLDFSLYRAGSKMAPTFATLSTDELVIEPDGSFEVFIGGERQDKNWLPADEGPMRLMVRQIHSDWTNELPRDIHIDRIDRARPLYPTLTPRLMSERLIEATNVFADDVRRWPELSRTRFSMLMPPNWLSPPQDTGSEGGLAGRWMIGGHFNLEADDALVIAVKPSEAPYQGIQLGHHWWEHMDYANRQSSLTLDQARVSSDGNIYFVISQQDPGVANWLDTEGFQRGVILMRWDGLQGDLSDNYIPDATQIKLSALREHLPQDEPSFSAAQRAAQIRERREHVQKRYGF